MSKVIKLKDDTIKELEKYREHFRETWDDLIKKILKRIKKWELKKK